MRKYSLVRAKCVKKNFLILSETGRSAAKYLPIHLKDKIIFFFSFQNFYKYLLYWLQKGFAAMKDLIL